MQPRGDRTKTRSANRIIMRKNADQAAEGKWPHQKDWEVVARWESGKVIPSTRMLARLAKAIGIRCGSASRRRTLPEHERSAVRVAIAIHSQIRLATVSEIDDSENYLPSGHGPSLW